MKLEEAIQNVIDYWEQKRVMRASEIIDSVKVVGLNIGETDFNEIVKWCLHHRPIEKGNQ